MIKKSYKLTKTGIQELKTELAELIAQRGHIAEKIAIARDFGDLSENAEYDSARNEQGLVESRISEIEDILMKAELIKTGTSHSVSLGSIVEVKAKNGKHKTYNIVGAVEANPLEGKVSDESPIGQTIIGKSEGDKFTVKTPKGEVEYEITEIK